jgi:fermentation-respiration switch protein FrsA (DUF1100 family)
VIDWRGRNELTLHSLELYSEYEPGDYISRIAPTPLLIITGDRDALTPTDEILAEYQQAREPKHLLIVPGGHHDLYGTGRTAGTAAAIAWFGEHLAKSVQSALDEAAVKSKVHSGRREPTI